MSTTFLSGHDVYSLFIGITIFFMLFLSGDA